jgi:hypothetical protein
MLGEFASSKWVEISCIGKKNIVKYIMFYVSPPEAPIRGRLLVGNSTLKEHRDFFLDSSEAPPAHIIVPKRPTVSKTRHANQLLH